MKHKEPIVPVTRLRSFYEKDENERLGAALRHLIEDPIKPKTDKGTLRVNPILVLLTAMTVLAVGTFLIFSLVQL